MKPYTYEAAWVPHHTGHDFRLAASIAIQWAEQQAATRGAPVILLTDSKAPYRNLAPYNLYKDRHFSRANRPLYRPGAVIADAPSPVTLDRAMSIATGNALVVIEGPGQRRLYGWAQVVGAVQLDTGQIPEPFFDPPPPAPFNEALRAQLQHLAMAGNNGYHDKPGRRDATRLLGEMSADGTLDRDLVLSALAAMGISPAGLDELERIIGRLALPQEEFIPRLNW